MVKVIVVITTYNLEEYISKALDSVIKQKTNFEYRVLVADDCSTDDTLRILKKYEKLYPDKIEILQAEKNMGSLANSNRVFDGIQCEYFSFLDGDDYWIGDDRLQKQVDFLDTHKEYSMCAGNTVYLIEGREKELLLKKNEVNKTYSFDDYLSGDMPFCHTSAILVRNTIFKNGIPECYKSAVGTFEECALRGEDFRRILHLERGPLYVMDSLMSAYRIHERGIWQGSSDTRRMIETAIGVRFYSKYFGDRYGTVFKKNEEKMYNSLIAYLLFAGKLYGSYELSYKESCLLTGLLNDYAVSNPTNMQTKKNKKIGTIRLKLIKAILKLLL